MRHNLDVLIGVDVAADRINYVVLSADATFIDGGLCIPDDLGRLGKAAAEASVVAIDAPAQLSRKPHAGDRHLAGKFQPARCAEVALGRNHGIWVPWVGPSEHPTDGWIATGLKVYSRLQTSGNAELIEVFPYAAFRVLTHPARLAKKTSVAGVHQRVAALRSAGLELEHIEMWSHDFLDAAVAAIVALDRLQGAAVRTTCGHDDSALWLPGAASDVPLVRPEWPSERFFLVAIPEGWTLGPFADEDWSVLDDGSLLYADGATHPIRLRIRQQHDRVIHANDGDIRDMSFEIVPVSEAPPAWITADA